MPIIWILAWWFKDCKIGNANHHRSKRCGPSHYQKIDLDLVLGQSETIHHLNLLKGDRVSSNKNSVPATFPKRTKVW
jgi:hypothetical protein